MFAAVVTAPEAALVFHVTSRNVIELRSQSLAGAKVAATVATMRQRPDLLIRICSLDSCGYLDKVVAAKTVGKSRWLEVR